MSELEELREAFRCQEQALCLLQEEFATFKADVLQRIRETALPLAEALADQMARAADA